MVWQDITIAVTNVFLGYALIPQIYKNYKEKRGNVNIQTSILTTAGLYTMAAAMFTLQLYSSAAILGINATLWLTLFIQNLLYR